MPTKTPRSTAGRVAVSGTSLILTDRWSWTVDEFQRAYDLGIFGDEAQLELIEGEIIRKMPQKEPHTWAIRAMEEALRAALGPGYDVRVQMPLVFAPRNKPEPDVAVVVGSFHDYRRNHPTTAVLIVEMSDSTLERDRTIKAAIYARAGIAEYWIVNIPDQALEIYREPAAMPHEPLGHHYRNITRYLAGDAISPLNFPDAAIAVASLLP